MWALMWATVASSQDNPQAHAHRIGRFLLQLRVSEVGIHAGSDHTLMPAGWSVCFHRDYRTLWQKSPYQEGVEDTLQASLLEPHKTLSQPYQLANSELWEVIQGMRWSFALSLPHTTLAVSSREGRKADRRDGRREANLLRRCPWYP